MMVTATEETFDAGHQKSAAVIITAKACRQAGEAGRKIEMLKRRKSEHNGDSMTDEDKAAWEKLMHECAAEDTVDASPQWYFQAGRNSITHAMLPPQPPQQEREAV